jgi:hypothetical protein
MTFGEAVPLCVSGAGLGNDAGADSSLRDMLHDVGDLGHIIVKPAGLADELLAGAWGQFALGVNRIDEDEAALMGDIRGLEC